MAPCLTYIIRIRESMRRLSSRNCSEWGLSMTRWEVGDDWLTTVGLQIAPSSTSIAILDWSSVQAPSYRTGYEEGVGRWGNSAPRKTMYGEKASKALTRSLLGLSCFYFSPPVSGFFVFNWIQQVACQYMYIIPELISIIVQFVSIT